MHFSQAGSALQVIAGATGSGTGTIDSTTGAFTLTIMTLMGFPQQCGAVFQAQVDSSGNTFTGAGGVVFTPSDCHSISCACSGSSPAEFRGSRSPCGNDNVDPGEQCDDGNLGRSGDCCTLGCTVRPDGSDCSDGLFCNGQETSCQSGACQVGTAPCPFYCNEATDTCMSGCPSTPLTCRMAARSRLLSQHAGDGGKDRLAWRWTQGASTSQMEFADPASTTDYALCIFEGLSPALIGQAIVPASAISWRTTGTTGYRYKDAAATAAGIAKLSLKGSTVNKSRVQLAGKGVGLPDLPLPLIAPVTVQLVNETSGLCWGASFSGQELIHNEPDQLKAKAP